MPVHAFIFPGQGSQTVGMGRDLAAAFAAAREVFQEIDETLKQKLSKLMFEGPHEELTLTENTQPALLAHSLAVLRVLEREGGTTLQRKALVVAGHSLGEYSALAAAGGFSAADAARLLKLRGRAMQKAVPAGIGAMAALLGADMEQARQICAEAAPVPETGVPGTGVQNSGVAETGQRKTGEGRTGEGRTGEGRTGEGRTGEGRTGEGRTGEGRAGERKTGQREIVQPANDNGGGQVVISGHRGAVERAIEIAKQKGIRRALLLPVSAPFHCALMAPAAEAMAEALRATPPKPPCVPLVANVSARRESDPGQIRDLLIQQVTATVRWRECVVAMTEMGVDRFIELGAGKVLTGLIKRIAPDASGLAAGSPAEIEAVLKRL
ncbi:acyltransferase domain-containing protein [Rhodopila sp.]|uniref:acyltransferase domain-containing protein n=1 Tax=Rhodopila sp. TaxID=2480087 RepID=UPI003D145094